MKKEITIILVIIIFLVGLLVGLSLSFNLEIRTLEEKKEDMYFMCLHKAISCRDAILLDKCMNLKID